MISGVRVIRHTLNENQFLMMTTSQYYKSLFYGFTCLVFVSALKKHQHKMDISQHKLLKVLIRDWQMIFPRDMLDTLGDEHDQMSSLNNPLAILSTMAYLHALAVWSTKISTIYTLRRSRQTRSYNVAKKRTQAIGSRTDHILQLLDANWTNLLDKHNIRIYLKKIFF